MTDKPYQKPPITEGIIEIRFMKNAGDSQLAKFLKQAAESYPERETSYEVQVALEAGKAIDAPSANVTTKFGNHKLIGRDPSDLVVIASNRISTSRLAPYTSWEDLSGKALENYGRLKKIVGPLSIARVAARFINRIDVPSVDTDRVKIDDYLKIEPCASDAIGTLTQFSVHITAEVPEVSGAVAIKLGSVASPLIDHLSFVLDIDLFQNKRLPQRDDELFESLGALRIQKNKIFESFITDASRKLFDVD